MSLPVLSRPVRVCHVSLGLTTGGLERLMVDLVRFRDRERVELMCVALHRTGQAADDIRRLGVEVVELDAERRGLGRWALVNALARELRARQIDVVHTHNAHPHTYGTLAAKMAGVPVVIHTRHGQRFGRGFRSRLQFRVVSWGVDRIVAVSDDAARLCVREDGCTPSKVMRIWNGIDIDRFAYRGPSPHGHAISVARLSAEKDFPTLLRAVKQALPEIPNFRLTVVGNGPEWEKLQALTRELSLEAHVTWLGERHDVHALLPEAGFFVTSSLTEGVSLTLLEAMAVGLPILATAVGGNPEVVEQGVTGELVPANDVAALARGLVGMCRSAERWPAYGRAGRDRVERFFQARQMTHAYEALYIDLLARKRPKLIACGTASVTEPQATPVTTGTSTAEATIAAGLATGRPSS